MATVDEVEEWLIADGFDIEIDYSEGVRLFCFHHVVSGLSIKTKLVAGGSAGATISTLLPIESADKLVVNSALQDAFPYHDLKAFLTTSTEGIPVVYLTHILPPFVIIDHTLLRGWINWYLTEVAGFLKSFAPFGLLSLSRP